VELHRPAAALCRDAAVREPRAIDQLAASIEIVDNWSRASPCGSRTELRGDRRGCVHARPISMLPPVFSVAAKDGCDLARDRQWTYRARIAAVVKPHTGRAC